MSQIEALEQWFMQQCNGDWEHGFGVTIETLDNPGWSVTIELDDTDLEDVILPKYEVRNSEEDWIMCWTEKNKFEGCGDPLKLGAILSKFLEFAELNCAGVSENVAS